MLNKLRSAARNLSGNFGVILGQYRAIRTVFTICVVVYIIQSVAWYISFASIFPGLTVPLAPILDRIFGLYWPLAKSGAFWQPVTYAFLHGGFWHLVLNLFSLVFLGYAVEAILGTKRFWQLYLGSAIIGGIGWFAFDLVEPYFWQAIASLGDAGLQLAQRWGEKQSYMPNVCVGASAGVFGLMGAFAALCPNQRLTLLLFYVVPVNLQARYVAILLVVLNIVEMLASFGRVAYMAHLFGCLAGYLYAKYLQRMCNY